MLFYASLDWMLTVVLKAWPKADLTVHLYAPSNHIHFKYLTRRETWRRFVNILKKQLRIP